MGGRFDASDSMISPMVESHRRARSRRATLEQRVWRGWSLPYYPMLVFVRWRERRALSRLIAAVPSTAQGARCKLVYLMATMIADPAPTSSVDVVQAIDTLGPHRESLLACLRK
ncbi:MAG: hypothetical protein KDJ29_09560 [Hyphomicrobiales bacterium]|uniref:hypothetical protein n=1 Tax=Mesorhizobium sp. GR13 TaxID=2562308 RepID=UPI0010C0EF83|nr:hypothetical protein [Mesorhizobium sp. GR13]MCC2097128.1 hypothetical protein [Hyphomicrobiales bacterium]